MNEVITKEEIHIENMIYEIRGKQVMLDSDLAKLYHVETKRINEAVKNNPEKFPERYSFVLSNDEKNNLWSKFSTANISNMSRVNPRVFTEQGIYMLATVLKSKVATFVNIQIMDTFVAMRHYIGNNLLEQGYINNLVLEDNQKIKKNTNDIKLLQQTFDSFKEENLENELYFNGKRYDAYSKVLDIFNEAKNELIIIDRYTDKTMLDMIKNLTCKVILITGSNTKITKLDINKYNETYNNLKIIYNDTYHDRYFIIDSNRIYHSGNSVNHIGYRKSSINILQDEKVKKTIIKDIEKILSSQEM